MNNIYILDQKLNIILTLNNELPNTIPIFNDKLIRDLTTFENDITLELPYDKENEDVKNITTKCSILYPVGNDYQLYKIIETTILDSSETTLEIKAECYSRRKLLSNILRSTTFTNVSFKELVDYILLDSIYKCGNIEKDIDYLPEYKIEGYPSLLKALTDLCKQVDIEMAYRYEISKGKIVNCYIDFKEINKEIKQLYTKNINLDSLKTMENAEEITSKLICVGKDGLNFENEPNINPPKGYSVVGDSIISDRACGYLDEGEEYVSVFESNDITDPVGLFEEGLKYLQEIDKPRREYECNVVDIDNEDLLGRTVEIADDDLELYLEGRIVRYETSLLTPETNIIKFGDFKELNIEIDQIKAIQEQLKEQEKEWNKVSWELVIESNVGTIFNNGIGEAVVTAKVYKANELVNIPDEAFTWTKTDKDGQPSLFPNGEETQKGKQIIVNAQDYDRRATYNCTVEVVV